MDATTSETRRNIDSHVEKLHAAMEEIHFQLGRIALHIGRPEDAKISRLLIKLQSLNSDITRALKGIRETQAVDP